MTVPVFALFVFVGVARGQLEVGSGASLTQGGCPYGIYGRHEVDSCICLNTGLWRVSKEYCSAPLSLIGVSNKTESCFYNTYGQTIEMLEKVLTLEVPEVAQLSSSMHKLINRFDKRTKTIPIANPVYEGQSTLITFGELKWTLRTTGNESYCLVHDGDPSAEYCIFPDLQFGDKFLKIQDIEPHCEEMLPRYLFIQSSECHRLRGNVSCEEALNQTGPAQPQIIIGRALDLPSSQNTVKELDMKTNERDPLAITLSTTSTPEPNKSSMENPSSTETAIDDPAAEIKSYPFTLTNNSSTEKPVSYHSLSSSSESGEFYTELPSPSLVQTERSSDYTSAEIFLSALHAAEMETPPMTLPDNKTNVDKEMPFAHSFVPEDASNKKTRAFITLYDNISSSKEEDFDRNLLKRGLSDPAIVSDDPILSLETPSLPGMSMLVEDEDSISPVLEEIGHTLMRDQIDQYVDIVIAGLTGVLNGSTGISTHGILEGRYPILKLLQIMKMIMQRTCTPVKTTFFETALHTFIKVQLENFHVKEPYINPVVYRRVEYALKRCYNEATPHIFHEPLSSNSNPPTVKDCGGSVSEMTTLELDVYGDGEEVVKLDPTPRSSSGLVGEDTATWEPLTETVWKMFVNAHSYCYPHFKTYFNDHQTLTVSVLPLFNNQIQDIWLKSEGYDTTKGQLYGGILGDTHKVLGDVDNCVAASRYVSRYPWIMSRPMKDSTNKWRRRRRDVGEMEPLLAPKFLNNGTQLCMLDPDDPVAFLGKRVCS